MAKYYITTPIYYPNDIPHLGHAYTTIASDVLARWQRILGNDVFFLTGTDEHGKKIEDAAAKKGLPVEEFVNELIPKFKEAWSLLNIHPDRFIRTTDEDHKKVVQNILQVCFDKGDIYKGKYEGLYCTACEAYYTEREADDFKCPVHESPLENLSEESYFFKLSEYQDFLLDLYEKNPDFISPKSRRQEIINRVKEGLNDFSMSRSSFKWGIPLPFDEDHITYVWFDALINYLSGIGYLEDKDKFNKYWPADVHIIGKDILWFHSVYWPAMLKSAGIELPKKVFAHGWWTVESKKMGKSAGNAINVEQLVNFAGVDSARYYLLREAPFGADGDFSENSLKEAHNGELANKWGNLVSRVSALAEKYPLTDGVSWDATATVKKVSSLLEELAFDKALNEIFAFIDELNEYIQNEKPWESQDASVLYKLADGIKTATILLSPFMPDSSEKIAGVFCFDIDHKTLTSPLTPHKVEKVSVLFKKAE